MRYNFKQETDTAKLPTRHTKVSAGVDFYADEGGFIPPGGSVIISTGISWDPDLNSFDISNLKSVASTHNICLIIQSRSGIAFKEDIEASNAGVIDQDYVSTKENKAVIHVKLYNQGKRRKIVYKGDKVCQGIPQFIPYFDDVETLDDSRNGLGFGSSDKKEK